MKYDDDTQDVETNELDEETDEEGDESEENTEALEKEFLSARDKAMDLIEKKIAKAHKALDEALDIAEEYGVPFYSSISPLSQNYTPDSFYEKFGPIEDIAGEISGYENSPGEYGGWQHSAVC
jgi:hypothetical protein